VQFDFHRLFFGYIDVVFRPAPGIDQLIPLSAEDLKAIAP